MRLLRGGGCVKRWGKQVREEVGECLGGRVDRSEGDSGGRRA